MKTTKKNKRYQLKINDFSIDWVSKDSHFLFDTNYKEAKEFKKWADKMPFYPAHIYLFTSSFRKIALLSKEAFLTSASSVNKYLNCESKTKWFVPLPLFHVAGLAVSARAFFGDYSFVERITTWNAKAFVQDLISKKISYTSLVPAQVHDLVQKSLSPPASLQFALVGGGKLEAALYKKARALKWPLLPTYGMTEACSQIATAERVSLKGQEFPSLKILPHIKAKTVHGILNIWSPSLLTGYFCFKSNRFYDPKNPEGWLPTQDKGEIQNEVLKDFSNFQNSSNLNSTKKKKRIKNILILKGRSDDQVKVSGHLVSLEKLSRKLQKIVNKISSKGEFCITAPSHKRKGTEIVLVTNFFNFSEASNILEEFNKNIPSYEQIKTLYIIKKIPRTALLKINQSELLKQLYTNPV